MSTSLAIIEDNRKKLKQSQDDIAAKLGISRQHYNAIVNGKSKPSVELAKNLGELLGFSWVIFFENEVNN